MTRADWVSLVRIIFGPPLALMLYWNLKFPGKYPLIQEHYSYLVAMSLFFLLALTDAIDGRLARFFGSSRFGAWLDPFADKIFIWSYSAVFVLNDPRILKAFLIIFVYDLYSTFERTWNYAKTAREIKANLFGKLKMFFHSAAIFFLLLMLIADEKAVGSVVVFLSGWSALICLGLANTAVFVSFIDKFFLRDNIE